MRKTSCIFQAKIIGLEKRFKRSNSEAIFNASMDDNSASADIVDQASSYTEKNVEMRAINRQIKLISKIDGALKKFKMVLTDSVKKLQNQLVLKD